MKHGRGARRRRRIAKVAEERKAARLKVLKRHPIPMAVFLFKALAAEALQALNAVAP